MHERPAPEERSVSVDAAGSVDASGAVDPASRVDPAGHVGWSASLPRATRSSDRIISGAAAGWAHRFGVEPTVLRAALALLGLVGGLGLVLYIAAVVLSDSTSPSNSISSSTSNEPSTSQSGPGRTVIVQRRSLAIASATGACLVAARAVGIWPGDAIMVAAAAVAVGATVAWAEPDDAADPSVDTDDRSITGWLRRPQVRRTLQLGLGGLLLLAGVTSLASRTGGLANVGASASAIAVFVGGLAMFGAPALGRLLRSLDEERSLHIREDELARVSAHLHDSVLQSLVLIQRSDDPRRMSSLARRQERELRAWLYGETPVGEPTTVHEAVAALTSEIEGDHDVRVEAVVVGDQPLDIAGQALVAALREAVVNAARHAGVDRIDVFVEADDAELTGFVRDTGTGFDLETVAVGAVAIGHRGISDSIIARTERVGGSAQIDSQPGIGTEVELRIPRVRTGARP